MTNWWEKMPQKNEKKFSIWGLWRKITWFGTWWRIEETFKKSEQAPEKTELPDRNWEKVVVIRSNWVPTLWVIVWSFWRFYKVWYVVWGEFRGKDLLPSELEENQKKYNLDEIESSISKWNDYEIWQKVMIPRSSGKPSEAYITWYNPEKWLYSVGYMKLVQYPQGGSIAKNGQKINAQLVVEKAEWYGKFLTKEDLDELNK